MSYSVQFTGDGSSDDVALLLKYYTGSFVEPWRSGTFLWDGSAGIIDRHTQQEGEEAQYLVWADIPSPFDYEPGEEIMGQNFAIDEVTLTPDKYLVSANRVPRDKMRKAHFAARVSSGLGIKHANRLAREYDYRAFILAGLGARQAAATKEGLTVHNGGNTVTRSAAGDTVALSYPLSTTGAANFRYDLRQLGRLMDEDNVPRTNRWITYTPYINQVLLFDNTNTLFSKDFVSVEVGNDVQRREVNVIEGFKVLTDGRGNLPNTVTNNGPMPDAAIVTGQSKYQGNFALGASTGTPVAMAFATDDANQAPIGIREIEPMQHVVKYIDERMEWLFLSFMYVGGGVIHPYALGSIEVILN